MKKVFIVRLTETERSELEALVCKGKAAALSLARARILLKADQGKDGEAATDAEIAKALSVAAKTVFNVRRRWVEDGLEAALWRMEDVLEVYHRPYCPRIPLICMDEASKQLVGEVRQPLPMRPGQPLRYDSEYERLGTCNIFMFCEPLRGYRHVRVTARRTRVDWALALRDLLDEKHQAAERVVLVMDNLNTHSPASFYEAFAPSEARRLTERLEIHYTPKHGSWLNIAECELSVLGRQCLARRIGDGQRLADEAAAWEGDRNLRATQVNWQFTTDDARVKLRRLYPEFIRQDEHDGPCVVSTAYH